MPSSRLVALLAGATLIAAAPTAHSATARDCAAMASVEVPASALLLPNSGVRVTSATAIATSGDFCRVNAEILPLDPAAPPIRLELNLPEHWNGKALMFGGGGYNGSILSTGGTIRLQPPGTPIPLARGYATFGSDSGHAGSSSDGSFATNREALQNYALDAVKKTRDAAVFLIAARYGRPAAKLYFHGSSNGGKEAFGMIQRYPADLDGAMIFWPAVHLGSEAVQFGRVARALEVPGAWLNLAKRQRLHAAELEACDGLDGVRDGVISNPGACEARFDPATATVGGEKLRCPAGKDTSDQCLSDVQIAFLKTLDTPARPDFKLPHAGGLAGYNAWSADIGFSTDDTLSKGITAQGLGTIAPAFPRQPGMPFLSTFSDQYAKYFLTGNPAATWDTIDPEHPGAWRTRLVELAALLDHADPDLSAFRAHGGKILLLHGTADQILPTRGTEIYYGNVVHKMGHRTVESFLRFYELPGAAHSGWGSTFNPAWDVLGALDAWASAGQAPVSPVVTDTYAVPGRTRPLCEYPLWPKYRGHGDINQATSFICAKN